MTSLQSQSLTNKQNMTLLPFFGGKFPPKTRCHLNRVEAKKNTENDCGGKFPPTKDDIFTKSKP